MKKVLLIMPSFYQDFEKKIAYHSIPPIGLGYIASSIRDICEVRIFDVMGREEKTREILHEFSPDIIGISCLTTFYPEFASQVNHIRYDIGYNGLLIAGGPHITIEPGKTLQQLPLDGCVVGEGEEVMRELILKGDSQGIRGLMTKNGFQPREPIRELDVLPYPAYDLYELDAYQEHMIMPMRGCPYNCTYCSSRHIWGSNVRTRSPRNVVQEMLFLREKYGLSRFFMGADTFVINKRWVSEFADRTADLGFTYHCNGRLNLMTDQLLVDLKRSGCTRISYGVESAVQHVLDSINKSISAIETEKIIERTVDMGFKVHLYFMLSLPRETIADMQETIRFARRMTYRYGCSIEFQMTRVYPGTPLALTLNLDVADWSRTAHPGLRYPNVPLYLEYPFEKVSEIWASVRNELVARLVSPNPLVRRYRRMKQIFNSVRYARSGKEVLRKFVERLFPFVKPRG